MEICKVYAIASYLPLFLVNQKQAKNIVPLSAWIGSSILSFTLGTDLKIRVFVKISLAVGLKKFFSRKIQD